MAHDLFNASMMFVGSTPWHGLGVQLPKNATWEEVQATLPFYDALERPLFCAGLTGAIPDRKALVASNDGRYLATVGADYGVVQFSAMAEAVMRAIGSEAVFHTAGLLGQNGARGWLLGEIPNPIRVKNDPSEIRKFFLASGSHDGRSTVSLKNVATRVVCKNTLGAALGEQGWGASIRHTSNASQRVDSAAKAFGGMVKGMEKFGELANILAGVRFTGEQRDAVMSQTFPLAADASAEQKRNAESRRLDVLALAENGVGIVPEMRGSAWALFQGVTEWADHKRTVRGLKGLPATTSQSFESQLFGGAADVKQAGLAAIRAVAGV